jgi:hypothetical protein
VDNGCAVSDRSAGIEHMFDSPSTPVGSTVVRGWVDLLAGTDRAVSDAERVEQLRALEELKAAAAAAQAPAAADLDASVRARHAARGLPASRQGHGVGAQVALARRESPSRGGRHLGFANALVHEMPHTLDALGAGWLSEWRATLLVRETACLTVEDRAAVDRELLGDPDRVEALGDRALAAEARRLAYRQDPHAAMRRARRAESERTVTLRPAPDTMTYLTGLLPVAQGVATWAALNREADQARAAGDLRTRGQIMADTLVERVTGQATAAATPVEIQLVMTDRALLRGDHEPANIHGYGPVPAAWARDLIRDATTVCSSAAAPPGLLAEAELFLRRLFTHPGTGQLVAMESRVRRFPDALRDFLVTRDQTCRTPWCDAPVRHADHALDRAAGGATDGDNGQGLCEQCNYVKTAPGKPGHVPRHGTGRDSWIARHLTVVEPGPVELSLTDYVHGPAA